MKCYVSGDSGGGGYLIKILFEIVEQFSNLYNKSQQIIIVGWTPDPLDIRDYNYCEIKKSPT